LAYEWLREMMSTSLLDYHQEWPVWRLLNRPNSKLTNRPNDGLLRMEIPQRRMLVCFYEGWLCLLGVMHHLDKDCGGKWPEQWVCYQDSPYIEPVRHEATETETDLPKAKPWFFDENECRKTWERIFDLTLYPQKGFTWNAQARNPLLQAVVPVIYRSDIATEV